MTEIEIGANLVLVISLVVNAVCVPLVASLAKKCKHLEQKGATQPHEPE